MASDEASQSPSLGELLAPVLARVPREQQPLFVALAERMAADRYRSWAAEPGYAAHRDALLACARREEEIAECIEALDANAAAIQRDLRAKNPDLEELNDGLFSGRPLAEQIEIQARGERLGAVTWRSFARAADARSRETFETCALLEEESAAVLEGILGLPGPTGG